MHVPKIKSLTILFVLSLGIMGCETPDPNSDPGYARRYGDHDLCSDGSGNTSGRNAERLRREKSARERQQWEKRR